MAVPGRSFRWLTRAGTFFFLSLPFLIAPFVLEAALRFISGDKIAMQQSCVRWGSPDLHHYYSNNCRSKMIVDGKAVFYSFNEDGLRDRPRNFFSGGSIHLYGDSVLKGLYLNEDATLPRVLERRMSSSLGYPFLNAGLRMSSPTNQSIRFSMISSQYPPKAVVLFLNATDPADERFFRTQAKEFDSKGVPTQFITVNKVNWRDVIVSFLHQKLPGSVLALRIIREIRDREWGAAIQVVPSTKDTICGGLFRFVAAVKERQIPLVIVFLAHRKNAMETFQIVPHSFRVDDYILLKSCAKESGFPVIDFQNYLSEFKRDFFIHDKIHFSELGTQWAADKIEQKLLEILKSVKPRKEKASHLLKQNGT